MVLQIKTVKAPSRPAPGIPKTRFTFGGNLSSNITKKQLQELHLAFQVPKHTPTPIVSHESSRQATDIVESTKDLLAECKHMQLPLPPPPPSPTTSLSLRYMENLELMQQGFELMEEQANQAREKIAKMQEEWRMAMFAAFHVEDNEL